MFVPTSSILRVGSCCNSALDPNPAPEVIWLQESCPRGQPDPTGTRCHSQEYLRRGRLHGEPEMGTPSLLASDACALP